MNWRLEIAAAPSGVLVYEGCDLNLAARDLCIINLNDLYF